MKAKHLKNRSSSRGGLLVNMARTIGSALGSVAAEAEKFTREKPVRTRTKKSSSRLKPKAKSRRARATRNA